MILILTILVLFQKYSIDAAPVYKQASSNELPSEFAVFERATNADGCNGRTIWDIIWSCLATTFACTWVSVHPNIPFLRDNKWAIKKWRLYLMFLTLLAPEILLMWAFKQCQGALMIRETVNAARPKSCENHSFFRYFPLKLSSGKLRWTMTHAHYLQMGGFRVHCTAEQRGAIPTKFGYREKRDNGVYELTMTLKSFKMLLSNKWIDFPSISQEEIEDKSGRDAFTKAIAMLQLAWFILQIGARAHQNLAISELELTTAALASLNIVMYISWWDKPIDVLCPTIIVTKEVEKNRRKEGRSSHNSASSLIDPIPVEENAANETWTFQDDNITTALASHYWHKFTEMLQDAVGSITRSIVQVFRTMPELLHVPFKLYTKIREWQSKRRHDPSCSNSWPRNVLTSATAIMVLCITVPWHAALHPFLALIVYPVQAILASTYFPKWRTNLEAKEVDTMSTLEVIISKRHLRLLMEMVFSSEEVENSPFFCFSAITGAFFGAIHCAAWNFDFPSRVEERFWRVSSLCLLGLCFLLLICGVVYSLNKPKHGTGEKTLLHSHFFRPGSWMSVMGTIPAIFYIVSRICLLVLSITTLRALPPSAFETVQWSEFIPHI